MLPGDLNVLVIDDVQSLRVQLREMIKALGIKKVTVAANGEEAKQAIELEKYHLIVADWCMAPTDGMEFLKYIREHHEMAGVPFIMLTGENTKERVFKAISEGVDGYLMKPVTPAQLQKTIYDLLLKKGVLG